MYLGRKYYWHRKNPTQRLESGMCFRISKEVKMTSMESKRGREVGKRSELG